MFKKIALCEVAPLSKTFKESKMVRTASGNIMIEPDSDKAKIIQAEIEKHPTALFFRAKAIVGDEPNSNGDYFSVDELLDSYKSFEGVPFFSNHDNQNIENARGKVIFAEWVPSEKAVYTISFIDREAFPHICRGIEEEYITGVSMGCSVEYSICSICSNRAEKTEDYCVHIRNRKGRTYSGKAVDADGNSKIVKDADVFEYNFGIKFIELSAVVDPACASCHIEGIIPNQTFMKRKVANTLNSLYMLKSSRIEKEAGQEEIEQLNTCLKTLEEISIQLIQNRQQVEVEFASDLVAILSNLQEFVDELVGAGYGNMGGGVPGTFDGGELPAPEDGFGGTGQSTGAPPVAEGVGAVPVSAEQPMGGVGAVQGVPGAPAVQSPALPIMSPQKPLAYDESKLNKISEMIKNLDLKLSNTEDNNMAKRRTRVEAMKQRESATENLSNLWKEKQDFLGYINKVPAIEAEGNRLSVKIDEDSFIIVAEEVENKDEYRVWSYGDLTSREKDLIAAYPDDAANYFLKAFASVKYNKEGVNKMATDKLSVEAARAVPETVQEDQLSKKDISLHPREGTEENSITQKQLEKERSGNPEVITEEQLNQKSGGLHPREGDAGVPETITEDQLTGNEGPSPRTESEDNSITQKQLRDGGYTTNTEKETITEDQLKKGNAPWDRNANRNEEMFKSASDHMNAVIGVFADTSIATGCTPNEARKAALGLIDSTTMRYKLAGEIDKGSEDGSEVVDYQKRLAFWNKKNIKVSSIGRKDISDVIITGLKAVASDVTIDPDQIVNAIDVICEDSDGEVAISMAIDEKLSQESEEVTATAKEELKSALKSAAASEESEKPAEVTQEVRESERDEWKQTLSEESVKEDKPTDSHDTIVEATMEEIGLDASTDTVENVAVLEANRNVIKGFVKGALATKGVRTAAITNVTVDGDTVQIAVQTGEGEAIESVEIPLSGEEAGVEEEILPEGDLTGEAVLPEEGLPEEEIVGYASNAKASIKRKAQAPMGGGVPGTPGGVAGGPGAPEMGMEGLAPNGPGAETLTTTNTDDELLEEEIPTAGEKQPPYTICPECGSNDVDLEKTASGNAEGVCNACGAEFDALIKKSIEFIIKKPTVSIGETSTTGAPAEPEVPALPVAAQTRLDKGSLVRVASNRDKHGHVCPACGMNNCKPQFEKNASVQYVCPACGTDVNKDIIVNVDNPDESYLRTAWTIEPNTKDCPDCEAAAQEFAAMVKVAARIKEAEGVDFPMANCMERVARRFGGNAVATYGPCKGKPLADCLCGQLQSLGMSKVRHIERLGTVYTQKDPMDECVDDMIGKFASKGIEKEEARKRATSICGCMKKKFASEVDENPFLMAFAEDIDKGAEKNLTKADLTVINDYVMAENIDKEAQLLDGIDLDEDISAPLAPLDEVEVDIDEEIIEEVPEDETVVIEVSQEAAEELAGALETAGADDESLGDIVEEEVVEGAPDLGAATELEVSEEIGSVEEKEMALAMQTHKLRRVGEEVVKVAGKPKQIVDIEKDVRAGVPRAKATMGNEGADNIDVPMAKPSVPRAKATMGHEGADNIDVPMGLPDVAVDSSYMGVNEKSNQADMPGINNEIRGRVIASEEKATKEAKKLKEVDTVEQDVKAGVPRAKATIGNEGADNIDVPMADPSVPRAKATMGNEGADNIDVPATSPDVPIGDGAMGVEKSVQKDMPGTNDEYLTRVQAKQEVQRERIANARWKKATLMASRLLGEGRISGDALEDVVEALSQFDINSIEQKAELMFAKPIKTASTPATRVSGLTTPAIVIEAKNEKSEETLSDKLSGLMTIGDKEVTKYAREND